MGGRCVSTKQVQNWSCHESPNSIIQQLLGVWKQPRHDFKCWVPLNNMPNNMPISNMMGIQRNWSSLSGWNLKHLGIVWELKILSVNMHYCSVELRIQFDGKKEFRELILEFLLCNRQSSDWGLQVFLSVYKDFHTAPDIGVAKEQLSEFISLIVSKIDMLKKMLMMDIQFFLSYLPSIIFYCLTLQWVFFSPD